MNPSAPFTPRITPGPWSQHASAPLVITNAEGSSLCDARPGDPFIPRAEALANAQAISAVPELIQACREAWLELHSMLGGNAPEPIGMLKTQNTLGIALTKAGL